MVSDMSARPATLNVIHKYSLAYFIFYIETRTKHNYNNAIFWKFT